IEPLAVEGHTAKFDLSLVLSETPGGLVGAIEYRTALFDAGTMGRLGQQYGRLLEAIVADPAQCIARLPLLSDAERRQLIVDWNATEAAYPQGCLHQLFEAQAARTPDAIAVRFGDTTLRYHELNARANQLAWHLRSLGVRPESRVALCVERSPDLIVGLLGILKAGGCYVPLDPTYPQERLHFMLEDAQVSVLLTQAHLVERLHAEGTRHPAHLVRLDADWPQIAQQRRDTPSSGAQPDHLAYLIYTSGSTGTPKGVLVPHRGLGNLAQAQIRAFGVTPDSHVLQFASLSFDAAISEICMALLAGATLVLAARADLMPGPSLIHLLREQAITVATLPPSVLAVLDPADFPTLRSVIAAGEACPATVVARWATPERRFLNAYGPTETTVCATIAACADGSRTPPIGQAIANTQVYVLDQQRQPSPVGIPGEVYIGGVGVARGYFGRPDLTAERFVPNPFSAEPGSRLYRTGDLARYLPDGQIEYLGRLDDQIKLRGFRIELGEIAAVLRRHEAVRDAVVLVRADQPPAGGHPEKRLVAYVVGEQRAANAEPGTSNLELGADLRRSLLEQVPEYMVPSAFVFLDALPLTPNGKIDRRALAALDVDRLSRDRAFVPPQDALEAQLVQIWETVLQQQPIGVADNFFQRGGNSLSAVRLMAQIEQQLGQSLPLATIFAHPTIRDLAATLWQRAWPGVLRLVDALPQMKSPLVAIQPRGTRRPFFFVAPLGGVVPSNVLSGMIDLAPHLGADQPYYGLQLPGLAHDLMEHLDISKSFGAAQLESLAEQFVPDRSAIEDGAARCVEAIRAVQPHGPYLIGGLCTGSTIAFEIACQLQRQEQHVALLALVDPPVSLRRIRSAAGPKSETIASMFARLSHPDPEQVAWFISHDLGGDRLSITPEQMTAIFRQLDADAWWDYAAEKLRQVDAVGRNTGPHELRRLFMISQINTLSLNAILSSYVPDLYAGRMAVLRVEQIDENIADVPEPWQRLTTQPVESFVIPGDHGTVFHEPNIQVLAQALLEAMRQATEATSAQSGTHDVAISTTAYAADRVPLVAVPRGGEPLPLSFAQQRLWFLDQLEPGSAAYHIPTVVRLHGALQPAALQQALSALVERHES
ncbi:MAG TPA: amino acid adenylation domain-containing protein, partial [Herpetosiphonaceae bacterium]